MGQDGIGAERPLRGAFAARWRDATRWRDNDAYGHMNNVVYYEYFDSAVNRWLIDSGALAAPRDAPGDAPGDAGEGSVIGVVAETACRFFAAVGFPETVETGLAVARIGRSSVTYRLALWGAAPEAAAVCRYVHVYVDRATRRPAPLPAALRAALERLQAASCQAGRAPL